MGLNSVFLNNVVLIPALPLVVAFLIFIFSYMQLPLSKRFCVCASVFSSFIGLVVSSGLLFYCIKNPNTIVDYNTLFFSIENVKFYWGFYIDNLSTLMLVLVTSISMLVQLYSYGYMKNDDGFSRFFVYLNLFSFAMLMLVLSTNLFQAYIFWEIVGLLSYLLIGFWYKKESASKAARKAFWVNRIGDCALFAAIVVLFTCAMANQSIASQPFLGFGDINSFGFYAFVTLGSLPFTLMCLALVAGPFAKSAQIPFHTWLPDAMEGPTPISALIHSATMVGAGVFLIARLYPLLILSPFVLKTVAIVGLITALVCAVIALVQNDIKKILAYSTCSQLGFMFLALGASAYTGAIFHLTTHAYFKALLFLCAGAVITSTVHTQDVRFLGGLRQYIPTVAFSYLIGCLALSGLFLSGFQSKGMIFASLFEQKQHIMLLIAVIAALLSVAYMFRSYFLIFEGEYKGSVEPQNVHWTMMMPIVLLIIPSALLGMALNEHFQSFIYVLKLRLFIPSFPQLEIGIFVLSVLVCWLAFRMYIKMDFHMPRVKALYDIAKNKFYFDKCYAFFYEKVFLRLCKVIKFLEKWVIGGFNQVCIISTRFLGNTLARGQNGDLSTYIFQTLLFIVFFVLTVVVLYFRTGG